ncbi:penicillin-binding transpeptidase domain-containing protein [Leuconostoc citreum]|uniref:penicillin-binding transpeptidase domain-containing protein n=1 Tax=Leuconostoc citreum TaxID=33964 RepID=UPI001FBA760A|nr:penicillin-binding transpeptidase domain-containing protein [Leuconostoc citreum]MCJ2166952.1 PASTA domain-containing protein [Leuconostoc citreum]
MRNKVRRIPNKRVTKNAKIFGGVLLGAMTIVILGLGVRLFIIAGGSVDGHNLNDATRQAFMAKQIVPASRGKIYDATGQVLAENTTVYDMYAVLDKKATRVKDAKTGKYVAGSGHVVDKEATADKLSQVINMSKEDILKRLDKKAYQVEFISDKAQASKNLSIEQYNKIQAFNLPGINFTPHPSRVYPEDSTASHLIGTMKTDEDAKTGQPTQYGFMGIEAAENSVLSGKNGVKKYDGQTENIQDSKTVENGHDVYLTLDSGLQNTLETRMSELFDKTKADSAVGVLMEAKTGRIVAATQRPNFNANDKPVAPKLWANLLDQNPFEPGSTMKGITLAAAIETGKWRPEDTYQSGTLLIDGKKVVDAFGQDQGMLTYREGFWRSSNVAFARVEQQLGPTVWRNYLEKFRFLQSTNSGLNGEQSGGISFTYPIDQANTAYGQGISVTPLQMIQAYSAIANNGQEVKPYFVDKVVNASTGAVIKQNKTENVAKPIKASTAEQVRQYMIDVVNQPTGTAKEFDLRPYGYQIAAKTGTAQVAEHGQYLQGLNNAIHSVMVLAPEKNPKYIFYLAVKQPKVFPDPTIQTTMNKVFQPLMLQALNDSDSAIKSKTTKQTVPNVMGQSIKQASDDLTKAGFRVAVVGSNGKVTEQSLLPQEKSLTNQLVILTAKGNTHLPDMTGWSLTDAQAFAHAAGFDLTWSGSGYVTRQLTPKDQLVVGNSKVAIELKEKQ